MTIKKKAKPVSAPVVAEAVEVKSNPFDPSFQVKRVVIELLEEWLPRHTTHANAAEIRDYLTTLKGTINAR